MAPTSITRSSKTAGVGGTGSMRLGIRCLKGWRREHEKRRRACGSILLPFRPGIIGRREGASFRPDGPPTQRPDGGTDYIRRPVLPPRLAEWDKELMRFVRQAEERGRYDRQHDCMASDCLPC